MYTVIALAVLLSAAWLGLNFANRLVAPIRRLIGAANIVSTGNLYVQVPVQRSEGDLAQLGETFNRMTYELRTQRDDIVRARDLIDQRRLFTEAVLAGASAGVIGVDGEGRISILNRSAEKLIDRLEADVIGQPLLEVVPELKEIFANAQLGIQRLVQGQVTINRQNRERNLSVRVTTEQSPARAARLCRHPRRHHRAGRRAAHLGLGRHRPPHRPRDQEPADADPAFGRAAAAQIRQVDHRGPGGLLPMHRHDRAPGRRHQAHGRRVLEIRPHAQGGDGAPRTSPTRCARPCSCMRVGNADIDIDLELAEDPMPARFDRRLISQALTNIIKNATEAIAAVPQDERGRGRIRVTQRARAPTSSIDVIDNGIGLPKENRNRLLEPYVTTREKGTGLGLAIVGRILEEHGGGIELRDAAEKFPGERGAWMRLRFTTEPAAARGGQS